MSARNPSYAETNYAVRAPLVRWLEETGWSADRLVSRAGYRVLEVGRR